MTDTTQNIWLAKLAAWTPDPAEKALGLLRDPAGHEGGTVRELPAAFVVEVERYGRRVNLSLPRQTRGVTLVPVPLAEPRPT